MNGIIDIQIVVSLFFVDNYYLYLRNNKLNSIRLFNLVLQSLHIMIRLVFKTYDMLAWVFILNICIFAIAIIITYILYRYNIKKLSKGKDMNNTLLYAVQMIIDSKSDEVKRFLDLIRFCIFFF